MSEEKQGNEPSPILFFLAALAPLALVVGWYLFGGH
jgi:hypothetical protein